MWAGWSACVWWSSSLKNPWIKLALGVAVGAWHVAWMAQSRDQPPLRYLIMFGGYAIVQSTLFRFFRVPSWSATTFRLKPISEGRRQFAILEWLLLTTATALMITGAKRYQPLAGEIFWIGLPIVCISMAATAVLCVLAIASATKGQRRWLAYGSLLFISIGSMANAWLEVAFVQPLPFMQAWLPYYAIQSSFAILIATLAACGRLVPPSPGELESGPLGVKTPAPPSSDDDASGSSDDLLPFRRPPHT